MVQKLVAGEALRPTELVTARPFRPTGLVTARALRPTDLVAGRTLHPAATCCWPGTLLGVTCCRRDTTPYYPCCRQGIHPNKLVGTVPCCRLLIGHPRLLSVVASRTLRIVAACCRRGRVLRPTQGLIPPQLPARCPQCCRPVPASSCRAPLVPGKPYTGTRAATSE